MKQLFTIKTERDSEGEKVLSMRIGQQHFSFAVTDRTATELHALAYYTANEINAEVLATIYAQHEELRQPFHCVQVCIDYPDSVLVPAGYHNASSERSLVDTMYGVHTGLSVVAEPVKQWELQNIYAVPTDVRDWIARVFPGYQQVHHYTMVLETMPSDSTDHLFIDFTPGDFSFIVIKENRVLIAQTLAYTTPEDILYYLLKTCNQFSLSRGEVQLFISGMIEKESQLYRELYLYFLNVSFREPSWTINSPQANDNPAHFFTSLNDLARCVS